MKKFTKWAGLLAIVLQMSSLTSRADEGMWLPIHLARLNYGDMQKAGLKLTPEQLYNINGSSLKDAIVSFGGFCTGEIISPEGLILTNHHCGYGSIQSHSSVEKNYLRDGFWAYKKEEELPNPDLFVRFLVRMEDITQRVLGKVNDQMSEKDRRQKADEEMRAIKAETEKNTGLYVEVKSFFDGNEYYMCLYETFTDVRLVGTPPESVGKFGGDTDNWMWPRHTGDFSLFRVYMGKDGKPAPYSKDNVPLRPKHFLPVSTSGVKEGDFTMIYGFPGRTNRFLSSYGVKLALDISNPGVVSIRDKKLKLMKENMDSDPATRIKYASK
ncbi:MAG TPA: S46 family peptidase, partial [Catalimonadaceae bacterium]|nr:S46 family peptidase [Catalimonadaceae bacterium]